MYYHNITFAHHTLLTCKLHTRHCAMRNAHQIVCIVLLCACKSSIAFWDTLVCSDIWNITVCMWTCVHVLQCTVSHGSIYPAAVCLHSWTALPSPKGQPGTRDSGSLGWALSLGGSADVMTVQWLGWRFFWLERGSFAVFMLFMKACKTLHKGNCLKVTNLLLWSVANINGDWKVGDIKSSKAKVKTCIEIKNPRQKKTKGMDKI